MAGRAGLEPATLGFEDRCSIQLSYRPGKTTGASDEPQRQATVKAGLTPVLVQFACHREPGIAGRGDPDGCQAVGLRPR